MKKEYVICKEFKDCPDSVIHHNSYLSCPHGAVHLLTEVYCEEQREYILCTTDLRVGVHDTDCCPPCVKVTTKDAAVMRLLYGKDILGNHGKDVLRTSNT